MLSDWLDHAGARGIDAAMDLSVRPWGVAGAGAIVGVFEAGKEKASWLLLRHWAGMDARPLRRRFRIGCNDLAAGHTGL